LAKIPNAAVGRHRSKTGHLHVFSFAAREL